MPFTLRRGLSYSVHGRLARFDFDCQNNLDVSKARRDRI